MSEKEWLVSADFRGMYNRVVHPLKKSRRKLDLFCLACVRLVWHLLDHPALKLPFDLLEVRPGERVVPRGGHMRDLFAGPARALYEWRYRDDLGLNTFAVHIAHDLWADFYGYTFENLERRPHGYDLSVLREDPGVFLPAVMREIFANPFRPLEFDPAWRTTSVVQLAQRIYESREFFAMPVLADALQNAGCDNAAVLDHCRAPGQHLRGCWVLDLVLDTEHPQCLAATQGPAG